MAQFTFDIMDSAGYGYYRVWMERAYLLKLVMIPFLIKLACMTVVMVLGYEENTLRQGLILFPGALAEGWVLAQFLRTLLKNERWPTVLPADMDERILDKLLLRARGIVAATLVYALLALAGYFMRYIIFVLLLGDVPISEVSGENKEIEINALLFIPFAAIALGLLWSFRLMWIYIPFSVLMPAKDYLKALGGLMTSVRMLVLFLCSMAPVIFMMVMLSRVVAHLFDGMGEGGETTAQFIMIFLAVAAETVAGLVTTTAFVWAMRGFLPKNPDVLKDIPKLGE